MRARNAFTAAVSRAVVKQPLVGSAYNRGVFSEKKTCAVVFCTYAAAWSGQGNSWEDDGKRESSGFRNHPRCNHVGQFGTKQYVMRRNEGSKAKKSCLARNTQVVNVCLSSWLLVFNSCAWYFLRNLVSRCARLEEDSTGRTHAQIPSPAWHHQISTERCVSVVLLAGRCGVYFMMCAKWVSHSSSSSRAYSGRPNLRCAPALGLPFAWLA